MKTYWVYILQCSDGSFYTGSTSDLEVRLAQHQSGLITGFTSKRLPVKLVFSQDFEDPFDAVSAERRIKNWSRKKKEALINGDYDSLHKFAECQNNTHFKNNKSR